MRGLSVRGVLRLSALAMLSFVGYALMEMRFFLADWIPGETAAMAEAVFVVAVVGLWVWALAASSAGKRSGLNALLVLGGFTLAVGVYDLQYVFPGPLPWPLSTMVVLMLVTSLVAVIAVALVRVRTRGGG